MTIKAIKKSIYYKIIKYIVLCILFVVFILSLSLSYFTLKNPQEVIDRLEPLVPTITPNPVSLRGVAVFGDSQSDEYRADDNRGDNYPTSTKNWVEILAQKRNVNFGKWGSWGEPRRTGYEYNWGRTGATVASLIEADSHVDIAQKVKEGKVNVVIMYIGAIDFAPVFTPDGYEKIYHGELSDAAKKRKINHIVADIKTAVYTIKDAGEVRILLIKIPDWGNHPGMQIIFPFPDQRSQVTAMIKTTNDEIQKLAETENLAVLDPNDLYYNLPKNDNGKVIVGNVVLDRLILNNTPHNFYLSDGVHYGTVVNGLLANAILDKINPSLKNPIRKLSDKEILNAAGM